MRDADGYTYTGTVGPETDALRVHLLQDDGTTSWIGWAGVAAFTRA